MAFPTTSDIDAAIPSGGTPSRALTNALLKNMVANTPAGSTSVRQVANRCYPARNLMTAGAGRWQMTRSEHRARAKIVNPSAVFGNWRLSGAAEVTHGAGTVKASIEYPAGTFTLANECIAASNGPVAFPIGNTTLSFGTIASPLVIPQGATFYVRVLQLNDNGTVFMQYQRSFCALPGDAWETGTGTVSDKTTSGTFTSNVICYNPIAFVASSSAPAVLILGDSIQEGGTEGLIDNTGDHGPLARVVGREFGYAQSAIAGTSQADWNAASKTYRQATYPYFTHVANAYGVNDFNAGRTVAQLVADRATCAAGILAIKPDMQIIGCTLQPYPGTTDAFQTRANQTLGTNTNKVRDANDLIRAGIAGEAYVFDVSDAIDPYRSGIWPVDRNLTASSYRNICTFTASLATNGVLTVSAISTGTLQVRDTIIGSLTGGAPSTPEPGTTITSQLTGTAGSTGTYQTNKVGQPNAPIASQTMYTGGYMSNDGLHQTQYASEIIRDSGQAAVLLAYLRASLT